MITASWDEGLDEAQLAVATHGDSPLVVAAGAGTGKTRALTSRVASLLERATPPERMLLLTFTRRAADDMIARAARLVGLSVERRPQGGTFHAVAYRYLGVYAEVLGLAQGFGIMDPAEASDLMDLLRGQFALTGPDARFPRSHTLVDIYSRAVNTGRPIGEVIPTEYPWCEPHLDAIGELFRAFTARKRSSGLLDFDDLLLYWRGLLAHAEIGPHLAQQFDYVLVDEYQDVNTLQVDIVQLLAPQGRGLTVVGDEAQSIYGFRGADSRHLREFILASPDANVIRLERNFRSHQSIVNVANAIRKAMPDGGPPVHLVSDRGTAASPPRWIRCHDCNAEARAIVDAILASHEDGQALRDHAILVRAGHHSDLVELELSARRVPYRKYGGLRFIEAAHVKDFVAGARVLDNDHDDLAWYRLLRLHHNIGPCRARALLETLKAGGDDLLDRWPEIVASAPPATRAALSFTLEALAAARSQPRPDIRAEAVLRAIRPLLEERYRDAPARLRDLERLVAAAAAVPDLASWVAELTLDPPRSSGDNAGSPHLDEDYVVISTIHSAKGLEWPVVHVPHVIEGAIPIDMALGAPGGLEEERRLFYVAVTRARDELHLYSPLRLPHHRRSGDDRHSYALASRFLDDEVKSCLSAKELVPRRLAPSAPVSSGSRVAVDLDPLWT